MMVGRGDRVTPATSCLSTAATRARVTAAQAQESVDAASARTGFAAAGRPSHDEHGFRSAGQARGEALQLHFAVEKRALAFSLVLARLASSGSQRCAAAPWLQGRRGLARRAAGRSKPRAKLRRLRRDKA